MLAHTENGSRFEWVTGTTVESAAISSREDPVRLLTNLHHQGRGGLIRAVRARRGATGTAASIRGLGTLDLLLLEELIRVQGLVEEAALHRDSRGAGVGGVRDEENCRQGVRYGRRHRSNCGRRTTARRVLRWQRRAGKLRRRLGSWPSLGRAPAEQLPLRPLSSQNPVAQIWSKRL